MARDKDPDLTTFEEISQHLGVSKVTAYRDYISGMAKLKALFNNDPKLKEAFLEMLTPEPDREGVKPSFGGAQVRFLLSELDPKKFTYPLQKKRERWAGKEAKD